MLLGGKMKFYVLRLVVWLPNEVSDPETIVYYILRERNA
jgi:hypothetical protein